MQPSDNPYHVLDIEDRPLALRSVLSVTMRFGAVGLICGAIAGVYLERNGRGAGATGAVLLFPGIAFGLGIMLAAIRFVPGRRLSSCLLFPLITLVAFGGIGFMFDLAAGTWSARSSLLNSWMVMSAYASPGVLVLMLGCASIATPRSWGRFVCSTAIITLITGAAPLLTNTAPGVYRSGPRFFITMFLTQGVMFLLFGWVLGDTISDDERSAGQAA